MSARRFKWLASGVSGAALIAVAAWPRRRSRPATGRPRAASSSTGRPTRSRTSTRPATTTSGRRTLDYQIFQHLLEYVPGKKGPQPTLATSCKFVGSSLKTYSCTLRQNVKFHNGVEMTSADVKYSFDRVVKIKDQSGIYTLLSNLKSVTTNGKYGVVFHLKSPQSTWPLILTTGAAQIVPQSVYPAGKVQPNTSQQVGTGPYTLEIVHAGPAGGASRPNSDLLGPEARERRRDHPLLLEVVDDEARAAEGRDRHGLPRLHADGARLARRSRRGSRSTRATARRSATSS